MKREGLAQLADHMVDRAQAFDEYRVKVMKAMDGRRDVNRGLIVGACAGGMVSMIAVEPGACMAFTLAALVAIGNAAFHKRQITKKEASLAADRVRFLSEGSAVEIPPDHLHQRQA